MRTNSIADLPGKITKQTNTFGNPITDPDRWSGRSRPTPGRSPTWSPVQGLAVSDRGVTLGGRAPLGR